MTTHVEHAVTEVIPQQEPAESGESGDQRWAEQDKIKATISRWNRLRFRLSAEGFDD